MTISQHVKYKRVLKKLFAKLREKISADVVDQYLEMSCKLGAPVKIKKFEEDGLIQVVFAHGAEITFLDWGGKAPEGDMTSECFETDVLREEDSASYLEGTNLHRFYAQCLAFQESNPSAIIFAYFNSYVGTAVSQMRPNMDDLPYPRDRLISITYLGDAHGIQLARRNTLRS